MKPESLARRRVAATFAAAACLAALGPLSTAPARSQSGLDAQAARQYGGSYAIDCADPAAPHLRVTGKALFVEQNGQRMTARNVTSVASYFEPQTPKNFQVALIGEARGGTQLIFLAFTDSAGLYIALDGDPKVQEALGGTLLHAKYRRCDATNATANARSALPGPTAAVTPPAPATGAGAVPDISALLADPVFNRAYLRSIGPKVSERWLARLDGPASPTREQVVEGTSYVVIAVCKTRDCYDNSALFLYSAAQERVLGMIQQGGVKTLVGAPTPTVGAQLDRLWTAEWRQGQK